MSHISPHWKSLSSISELEHVINESKYKPAVLFKHDPNSPESKAVRSKMDADWDIYPEEADLYLIDTSEKTGKLSITIADLAGIEDQTPQIVLLADGVTMYDESKHLISFKKIKLALKIINRTFKWLETRA